jgi:secretion/DNA translocation related CpaE-like protein
MVQSAFGPGAPATPAARPLAVTGDPDLLDELIRLAAAAGTELDVAPDLGAARSSWASASLIAVGADAVGDAIALAVPRRDSVLLVGRNDAAEIWRHAVAIGATDVAILPGAAQTLVDRLAETADGGRDAAGCVAVIGGRGGAGATVLAAALAVTASRAGRTTALVDADPLGGGIDLVVGAEQVEGLRWSELAASAGRLRPSSLLAALPHAEELVVLSYGRDDAIAVPVAAMDAVLAAAGRGADLIVADVPRRLDPAAEAVLRRATTTLLVVPAEVRAIAAAGRVAMAVAVQCADLRVAVRGPAPSRLDAASVAASLGLPLAGPLLRPEPGLAAAVERGESPARRRRGPLAAFCSQLLESLPAAGSAAA